MLRKPVFWIVLVLVLAMAGGGYYYYTTTLTKPKTTAAQTLQTYRVRAGNLTISSAGTGTLIAASIVDVPFAKSGLLAEVKVQVGDKVKAGDMLARQGNLDALNAQIATDQLNILSAQKAVDDLYKSLPADRASAQAALVTAQKALTNAAYSRDSYQNQRCDPAVVTLYYGDLVTAQNAYDKVNNDFLDKYTEMPENDPRRITAYAKLYAANTTLQTALRNYNYCTGKTDTLTTVDLTAQAAAAQATYDAAKAKVDALKDGPDATELALAKGKLDQAKYTLAVDQKSLADTVLYAPIDGVVTAVNFQVGEIASGTFIVLADKFHPMIQTFLDESELDKIGLNYDVNVTFDALPENVYTGKVVQIDPALSTQGGVQYVKALVKLDEKSAATVQNLPTGMNAAVDVLSGQANNAVLIPTEALRTVGTKEYGVFVVGQDGKLRLVPVTIGLQSVTQVQILSGIKIGDTVSLGSSTTASAARTTSATTTGGN
jgi:HlyD family secretion protein